MDVFIYPYLIVAENNSLKRIIFMKCYIFFLIYEEHNQVYDTTYYILHVLSAALAFEFVFDKR